MEKSLQSEITQTKCRENLKYTENGEENEILTGLYIVQGTN
jgi:hypothetical protein